jgi:hypothetical protein
MLYFRSGTEQTRGCEPMRSWGIVIRYFEIGKGGYAVRHVDVFENGYALRYDREHWIDDFGSLANAQYDRVTWERHWGPAPRITAKEFERVWTEAASSPAHQLQLESGADVGGPPPWLRPKPTQAETDRARD